MLLKPDGKPDKAAVAALSNEELWAALSSLRAAARSLSVRVSTSEVRDALRKVNAVKRVVISENRSRIKQAQMALPMMEESEAS